VYQLTALRQHIALVMQDTLLFHYLRDNIAYGREDLDLDTVMTAAKQRGLTISLCNPAWL